MSGGIDSSIAAHLLCNRGRDAIWPLYVRRGGVAELRELAALRNILCWLRTRASGTIHRLRIVDVEYPSRSMKKRYPTTLRDQVGYAGREAVLAHVAVF